MKKRDNIYKSKIIEKRKNTEKEICNECGRSVKFGSGFYVNRIPDFNEYEDRLEMQKPFPEGEFMCIECDLELSEKVKEGNKIIASRYNSGNK